MPRPAQLPTFATDATYDSGPESGLATKVAFTSGEMAQGHRPASAPAAPKLNWWQNLVGQWVTWLDSQADRTFVSFAMWRSNGSPSISHFLSFDYAQAPISLRPGTPIASVS